MAQCKGRPGADWRGKTQGAGQDWQDWYMTGVKSGEQRLEGKAGLINLMQGRCEEEHKKKKNTDQAENQNP